MGQFNVLGVFVFAESVESGRPIGDSEVRVFVALFPYDPAAMSPNPDAAEEELPFREGQIIKVGSPRTFNTAVLTEQGQVLMGLAVVEHLTIDLEVAGSNTPLYVAMDKSKMIPLLSLVTNPTCDIPAP